MLPLDLFRLRGDVEAAHHGASGSGRQQPAQHADGGGFARAVGSQKAENLAGATSSDNVVHGDEIAEALDQLLDVDGRAVDVLGSTRAPPACAPAR